MRRVWLWFHLNPPERTLVLTFMSFSLTLGMLKTAGFAGSAFGDRDGPAYDPGQLFWREFTDVDGKTLRKEPPFT